MLQLSPRRLLSTVREMRAWGFYSQGQGGSSNARIRCRPAVSVELGTGPSRVPVAAGEAHVTEKVSFSV